MIDHLIQWIYAHPQWGEGIALLIAAAESIAIIGTIIPGSVMMTAIGVLIGTGVLPLHTTIICAVIGALLGDGISYVLGFSLRDKIRGYWPFRRYPKIIETGEHYFITHGAKSVFLGRFVGPVRAMVPLVAGMIGLKPLRFFTADILSAILWAPLYMLPGYLIGTASLNLPPHLAIHLILGLLIILICVLLGSWLFRLAVLRISSRIHSHLDRLWLRLQKNPREHFLTVWFKSTDQRHIHGQLGSALAILIFVLLLVVLLINIHVGHGGLMKLNDPIYYFFRGLRVYGIDKFFVCITFIGQVNVLLPAMAALALALYLAKQKRPALYCIALTFFTTLAAYLLKEIVHFPRPDGLLGAPVTYSFPSGHVTLSIAFYGFIAMLLLKTIRKPVYQKVIYYTYTAILLLVCFSRLYLGAHWFTDIIGGILLGGLCFFIMKVLYYREATRGVKPQLIIITSLLSIAVCWTAFFSRHFEQQLSEYQRTWPNTTISQQAWWIGNGKHPLLYRTNRFDHPKEALNIQWAGQLNDIKHKLNQEGWQSIQTFYWSDLLHPEKLAARVSVMKILPQLYRNAAPQAVFIRRFTNKQVLTITLWDTHIQLSPDNTPLWAGMLSYQQTYENKKPLPLPTESPTLLFSTELKGLPWKIVNYPVKSVNGYSLELSDKLLLIHRKE